MAWHEAVLIFFEVIWVGSDEIDCSLGASEWLWVAVANAQQAFAEAQCRFWSCSVQDVRSAVKYVRGGCYLHNSGVWSFDSLLCVHLQKTGQSNTTCMCGCVGFVLLGCRPIKPNVLFVYESQL